MINEEIRFLDREEEEENFVSTLWYKFFPFWPLLAVLSIILVSIAYKFSLTGKPVYTISAALVIKKEKEGGGESQLTKTINMYASNKVAEDEVQILQSRTLINEVVINMSLYAPVYEKTEYKAVSAYGTSPVVIRVKNPQNIRLQNELPFTFNEANRKVRFKGKWFNLNEWINSPFGAIMFETNPRQENSATNPLFFSLVPPPVATESVMNNLKVASAGKLSSIINIQYQDENPLRGVDFVNNLLEAYNRASLGNKNQLAANTLAFVDDRLREVASELDSIERRIQRFRSTEGVIDVSEQGRLYLQNVSENEHKAADINVQLAVLDQVESYVRSGRLKTGIIPTSLGIEDPVLAQLLQRLNELELQYSSLRATTGENNPAIKSIENEIAKIRPNILTIVTNQRARLQAGRNNLNSTANRFSSQLKTLPAKERELLEISRQQATKREIFNFLLERREEADLANAAAISDSRVIDQPQASILPAGPNKLIYIAGAIILAFILTIAYILFKELFSSKILFRSDLEQVTNMPVVAEILYDKKHKRNPFSQVSPLITQQLNHLQLALGLFQPELKNQKILITSALPNEGKTFITNHLAINLANAGKSVILVDFNFYTSELSTLHNLSSNTGLKEYLADEKDLGQILYKTGNDNIDIIPAGAKKENRIEWITNKKVEELFFRLTSEYEFILFDTPPVEPASDASILSKYADVSIFVVRHNRTPNSVIEKLVNTGKLNYFKEAAIVFNGLKGRGFVKKYYGYKVGYGYEKPIPTQFSRLD